MERIILLLVALSTVALAACNTMSGLGKDLEIAGEKIQKKAK